MIKEAQDGLIKLFETEIGVGGKLEGIKSVNFGQQELLASSDIPAIGLVLTKLDLSGNNQKAEITYSFEVWVKVVESTIKEAIEKLDGFVWTKDGKGIIPILATGGYQENGITFKILFNKVEYGQGAATGERCSVARIPVTVTTWTVI